MCGILGIFSPRPIGLKKDQYESACNVIAHRGPDDFGYKEFEQGILGFRRLSIIDLTQNGHQPMSDSSQSLWIVFNGEIYNYKDLRNLLREKGHDFRTNTDTEVILEGYREYGDKVVEKLHGMFAFIIYDSNQNEVFAARDRMGKKPLFIFHKDKTLILCSEIKQLTTLNVFDKAIDHDSLHGYLQYGAISQPKTIFKGVQILPAGSILNYSGNVLEIKKYWQTPIPSTVVMKFDEAKERLRGLVDSAVRSRLMSDVPLGAFLSGGVDSSIIVALMRHHYNGDIKTFSVTYKDAPPSYDESRFANLVARRFQTSHYSIEVSAEDIVSSLDDIVWKMDQPSCDAINTYFVSKAARREVAVALSGVGADELFAGYSTFKFASILGQVRHSNNSASHWSTAVARVFYLLPREMQASWYFRLIAGGLGGFPSTLDRYNLVKQIYNDHDVAHLLSPSSNYASQDGRNGSLHTWFDFSHLSDVQKITLAETNNYLQNTLLRDTDVMGMAHSLEIRAPFVDHTLIEFAMSLPDNFKITGYSTKRILKESFADLLPEEVISRKKVGFAFPLAVWLKNAKLRDIVDDCLSERSVRNRGWFDFTTVSRFKNEYFSLGSESVRTYQSYQRVWELVVLELWARKYLD